MNKFFGILLVALVSVVFFSCAPAATEKVVDSQGNVAEIFSMEKDYLFEVFLEISSGDIQGKTTHGDPIEFQKFFTDKKDLIQSVGFTEAELKEVFKNCVYKITNMDDLNEYNLLQMRNFKFLVLILGKETPLLSQKEGERNLGDLFKRFDGTRRMILDKL